MFDKDLAKEILSQILNALNTVVDRFSPIAFPIQCPILDCLGNLVDANIALSGQVGQGPGNLQDPIIGPGGEAQFVHRGFQQTLGIQANGAMRTNMPTAHPGVAKDPGPCKTPGLNLAGHFHPFADGG